MRSGCPAIATPSSPATFTYTAAASNYNDENIFVLDSPYERLPKAGGGQVDKQAAPSLPTTRDAIERVVSVSGPWRP